MQVFGIVGPDGERAAAADRLVERFEEHGRVGVVADRAPDLPDEQRHGATVVCAIGDGRSLTSSPGDSLEAALDRLAPECAYAVVLGRPGAPLPQVVVGSERPTGVDGADATPAGEVLVSAPDAAALDPAEVVGAVDALEPRETLASLVARAKASTDEPYAGAIATFTGRVRAKEDPGDDYTTRLEFEKYDGVADERMAAIRDELEAREGVYEVLLHHRTGVVEAGTDIVFVVVLAGHRAEAFETVEDGIDRLKAEVPLFKKEVTVDGEFWAHERDGAAPEDATTVEETVEETVAVEDGQTVEEAEDGTTPADRE